MDTPVTTKGFFASESIQVQPGTSAVDLMQVEAARAAKEVEAAVLMAKKFPRDQNRAYTRIMEACRRPRLAEAAVYAYPRGKEKVSGPSIRLAEALAQAWGNLQTGWRELSQEQGLSIVEAYCWDLETNTREVRVFHVPHVRHTRDKEYGLSDPRDIYELVANQAARRKRACILAAIPGDIVEEAVRECEKTLIRGAKASGPLGDRVRKMVDHFASHWQVTGAQLETFLGHGLDAVSEEELAKLKSVSVTLKDGAAKREDFFAGQLANDSVATELEQRGHAAAAPPPHLERAAAVKGSRRAAAAPAMEPDKITVQEAQKLLSEAGATKRGEEVKACWRRILPRIEKHLSADDQGGVAEFYRQWQESLSPESLS